MLALSRRAVRALRAAALFPATRVSAGCSEIGRPSPARIEALEGRRLLSVTVLHESPDELYKQSVSFDATTSLQHTEVTLSWKGGGRVDVPDWSGPQEKPPAQGYSVTADDTDVHRFMIEDWVPFWYGGWIMGDVDAYQHPDLNVGNGVYSITLPHDSDTFAANFDVSNLTGVNEGYQIDWIKVSIDAAPANIIASTDVYAKENNGGNDQDGASFTITRTGGNINESLEVTLSEEGGTATENVDYSPLPPTVTFQPGQTHKTLTFQPIQDEKTEGWDEGGESVKRSIVDGGNYIVGENDSATAWILDDTFTYTAQELASDATVAAAINQAWASSNPNGPTADKVEQGFWIYHNYQTSQLEVDWAVRDPATPPDELILPPIDTRNGVRVLVGWFHTHPFTLAEGKDPGPSQADEGISTRFGVPGILKNHGGLEYFGPDESPNVIG